MKNGYKNTIHEILIHSYFIYFILFLIGICLDILFKFRLFSSSLMTSVGASILILGSILILWAQRTSQNLNLENISKDTFLKGPYRYSRSPTHWGLLFLMFGFGLMINEPFVILSTIISFIISKFIFLNKQEMLLADKYGTHYLEYKESVKF